MFNPGTQPSPKSPSKKVEFFENETSEFRQEMSKKLRRFLNTAINIKALHGKTVEEVFTEHESVKHFLRELEPEDYTQLLEGLNGILRGKDQISWSADGHSVTVGSWTFPTQSDKVDLLRDSLTTAKLMIESDRDITDIAYLLSSTITACHLFENGNGRTSRAVFLLINKGFGADTQDNFEELMSSDGELSTLTNPNHFYGLIRTKMCTELGVKWENIVSGKWSSSKPSKEDVITVTKNLSEEMRERFINLLEDHPFYTKIALLQFNKTSLPQYINSDTGEVDILELIARLTNENCEQFFTTIDIVKKQYVVGHPQPPF